MRASGLLAAMCLTGVLGVPSWCAGAPAAAGAGAAHSQVWQDSDLPVRPGIKNGEASASPQDYGDEPGAEGSARNSRHDNPSTGSTSAQPVPRAKFTARSAVLDTLGTARADSTVSSDSQNLGLKLRPLTASERQTFGVEDGGLVVTSVSDGLGQRAGFRPGDVVLMLNGVDVVSPGQFCKLIQSLPHDRPVPVLVRRPGSNVFLPLGVPSRP